MNLVIIGNGVAGVTVAETVRRADADARITIFSDEAFPHYSRPRLIELLTGKTPAERIVIHARDWYDKNRIDLRLSTHLAGVDLHAREVRDDSGRRWPFDNLVIASGARCSVPPLPGMEGSRILTLRTIEDAERIRTTASMAKRAVIIGGGLTGIETAFALAASGIDLTVLEMFDHLLPRQLDHESSGVLRSLLENKGIKFITAASVRSVVENDGSIGLLLQDGRSLSADFAVVAAGAYPRTRIVEGTSIARNRAIVVDRFMRTSEPGVYACGDVAECDGIVNGLWMPAREQGIACGNHLVGKEAAFAGTVPAARLKVAGIEFASIGDISGASGATATVERDDTAGSFRKLFMREGRLCGAILIGSVKEALQLQARIRGEK